MKLDPDCVRDVLIEIEEKSKVGVMLVFPSDSELLPKYGRDKLEYHLRQCVWNGFVKIYDDGIQTNGDYQVKDLAPPAHTFLANIRSDTIWKKTKEAANKVGSISLDVLATTAAQIVVGLINGNF